MTPLASAIRVQRLCRAVDQDPKKERRWTRVYDDVDDLQAVATFVNSYKQQRVAHPAPLTPHPEGEVRGQPQLRGGVIVMTTVQRSGRSTDRANRSKVDRSWSVRGKAVADTGIVSMPSAQRLSYFNEG